MTTAFGDINSLLAHALDERPTVPYDSFWGGRQYPIFWVWQKRSWEPAMFNKDMAVTGLLINEMGRRGFAWAVCMKIFFFWHVDTKKIGWADAPIYATGLPEQVARAAISALDLEGQPTLAGARKCRKCDEAFELLGADMPLCRGCALPIYMEMGVKWPDGFGLPAEEPKPKKDNSLGLASAMFGTLCTTLIVLRMLGSIDWSWWAVLVPCWMPIVFCLVTVGIDFSLRHRHREEHHGKS